MGERMKLNDKYGGCAEVYQGRNGKVYLNVLNMTFELTHEQSDKLPLMSDAEFNYQEFCQAYDLDEMGEPLRKSTYRLDGA